MFTPDQRKIFKYTTPQGVDQYADPHRVQRLLNDHTKNEYVQLVRAYNGTGGSSLTKSEALEALIQAVLAAFELQSVGTDQVTGSPLWFNRDNGEGWLEEDLIGLMSSFNEYVTALKKSTETTATG